MMSRFPWVLLLAHLFYSTVWSKTVRETLRITWEEGAPNGQSRQLIHTNGQFPSPTLVWDEGDDVEVRIDLLASTRSAMLILAPIGNCH
jgi:FtsP/CotA-like multicopper oxidase with cupredoxin domain